MDGSLAPETFTDLELVAGQFVKIALSVLFVFGLIFNLIKSIKAISPKTRMVRLGLMVLFGLLAWPMIKYAIMDGYLWLEPVFAQGRTIGHCEQALRGKALAYEYEIEGKTYRGCQTYHPISLSEIQVEGGHYWVRYSPKYPWRGKIYFNKAVD
ncbi:MAG: hypothetical protein HYZ16_02535 [Bacteroidetes bacterium]|jgi:hypothetical protein|nr:hypothetical protein [Bacteroidota bacterium]